MGPILNDATCQLNIERVETVMDALFCAQDFAVRPIGMKCLQRSSLDAFMNPASIKNYLSLFPSILSIKILPRFLVWVDCGENPSVSKYEVASKQPGQFVICLRPESLDSDKMLQKYIPRMYGTPL